MHYSIEGKKVVELYLMMEVQYYSEKRYGLVGDNFNDEKVLKKLPGNFAIGHNRYSTTGGTTLRNIQPFFADTMLEVLV